MIYFIRQKTRSSHIKIGFSRDPRRRLKDLQTATTIRLELLGVLIDGTLPGEKELHEKFAKARVSNEWFKPCAQLLEFIAQNAGPTPDSPPQKRRDNGPRRGCRTESARVEALVVEVNRLERQIEKLKKQAVIASKNLETERRVNTALRARLSGSGKRPKTNNFPIDNEY